MSSSVRSFDAMAISSFLRSPERYAARALARSFDLPGEVRRLRVLGEAIEAVAGLAGDGLGPPNAGVARCGRHRQQKTRRHGGGSLDPGMSSQRPNIPETGHGRILVGQGRDLVLALRWGAWGALWRRPGECRLRLGEAGEFDVELHVNEGLELDGKDISRWRVWPKPLT